MMTAYNSTYLYSYIAPYGLVNSTAVPVPDLPHPVSLNSQAQSTRSARLLWLRLQKETTWKSHSPARGLPRLNCFRMQMHVGRCCGQCALWRYGVLNLPLVHLCRLSHAWGAPVSKCSSADG